VISDENKMWMISTITGRKTVLSKERWANSIMVFVYIKNKKDYLIMISNNDLKKKNKIYKSNNKREKR